MPQSGTQRVHQRSGSCTPCAQETLHHQRMLRLRRSLSSVRIQQDQRLPVLKDVSLVWILGFHVVGIPDVETSCAIAALFWSLNVSLFIEAPGWIEISKDVRSVTGVVLGVQILQIRVLEFRFLQIRQLAVVGDPGTRLKNLTPKLPSKSSFHKRAKNKKKC